MKRAFLPVFLFLLLSCGEAELTQPGSWGAEETNTLVFLDFFPASADVDVCAPAAAHVSVDITTETINPGLPENTLFLERYTVEYTPFEQGAPSIQGASVDLGLTLPAEALPLKFIGSALKEKLRGAITAESPYTAKYTFSGRDKYGSGFGTTSSFSFTMGRVTGCPPEALEISPASLSVSGIANHDGDPSDDMTFYISGGEGPYTVYSSKVSVIAAPGPLARGEKSFTVDAGMVLIAETVTITVVDSSGLKAKAVVTVNPF